MSHPREQIRAAILEGLKQVAPEADLPALPGNANIRQTLEIDSFDFLKLLIELNQRLRIEIPEADYGQLTTLDSLSDYLAAKLN